MCYFRDSIDKVHRGTPSEKDLLEHGRKARLDDLRVVKLESRGHNVENLRNKFSYTILKYSPSELNEIGTCFDILDFMNIVFPKIAC
jgi:hypothetical protein